MGPEINAMLETSGVRMIGGIILILGVVGFFGIMFYGLVIMPISDVIWNWCHNRRVRRILEQQKLNKTRST